MKGCGCLSGLSLATMIVDHFKQLFGELTKNKKKKHFDGHCLTEIKQYSELTNI